MNDLDKPDRAEAIVEKIVRDYIGFGWACKEFPAETQNCADQISSTLRAYRNEALEEAAKVCEESLLEHPSTIEESGWVECTKDPEVLAREIRELKTPERA